MAKTSIRGTQILNNTVQRQDIDTLTTGQALVTKLVQGTNVTLSSTGADSGTGDVTVSVPNAGISTDSGNIATLGSDSKLYVPDPAPIITAIRLRSFSSVGNGTFEVDQRQCYSTVSNPAAGVFVQDRWQIQRSIPTGVFTWNCQPTKVNVPGTSFCISQRAPVLTVTTQQSSLATGDYCSLYNSVEGPSLRELINDVHSLSILAYSNVAGATFSVSLRDAAATYSLVNLCTIPSALTWTLFKFPSLPIWTSSATWNLTAGNLGYILSITVACGTTYIAPSAGTWVAGNYLAAPNQTNFFANAVNSYIGFGFIQHCPGSNTDLIDVPFSQNLDGPMGCLRYFTKSYLYGTRAGTVMNTGEVRVPTIAGQHIWAHVPFKRTMAKAPTVTGYSSNTGTINAAYDMVAVGDRTITSVFFPGDSCFGGFGLNAVNASQSGYQFHYTADTGW